MSTVQATTNKATFRRFYDAMTTGDAELISKTIDELVEPDALIRTPLPIEATGAQILKEVFARLHRAYPDLQITVEDVIAEGDKVVSRNSVTGTHQGEYMGIPPTGKSVTYNEIFIVRFEGARIAETWGVVDVLSQMRQLGAIPGVDLPASRSSKGRTSKTKGAAVASTPEQAQDISVDDLRAQLEGELITPDDPSYDDARQVFFKGVDKRPLAVAQVSGADDVAAVVNAAREGGLELAVRSGGHSRPGYGTIDGGLVIDLSRMDGVEMDADDGTAWVETGATARKYTLAAAEKGRATGLGDTGSVGIGGITLAGGIGFVVRKTGLTIDNLLAAEVVTADGEVVQASDDSEPDLFWAIRGGEGNFGVATRLQLRLAEISEIVGGMLILPASPHAITGFLEAAQAAPVELSTIANVTIAPPMPFLPEQAHGKPVVMGQFAYVGPVDQAEQVIAPFRALAEPLADMVRPMRYPELYEGPEQKARFAAGTNFFADSLEPAAAEAILEQLPKSTAPMRAVQLRVLGGALARVPNDATAFAHRDRGLFVNVATMYMDAGEKDAHDAWVDGLANSLGKDGAGGYVGFLGEEDEATIRAAYPGATWDRLRELKRRYDPDNLFHLNHNIPPAEG